MAPSTVTEQERAAFADDGFFLRRGAISKAALQEARSAFDRLFGKAQRRGGTGLEDGAHFVLSGDPRNLRVERIVWAGGAEPTLLAIAEDPTILDPALALLGSAHCDQLLCQAHFKMPGDGVSFAWHQDIQHRDKGPGTWVDVNGRGSYVQTILLLDPMGPGNGALKFLPRSTTGLARGARLSAAPFTYDEAMAPGEDPPGTVLVEGDPGDVLFFGPYAVHGSSPNEGTTPRRVLINGYAHPGANHRVYPGEGAGRRLPRS
jgi:hypothetical protein